MNNNNNTNPVAAFCFNLAFAKRVHILFLLAELADITTNPWLLQNVQFLKFPSNLNDKKTKPCLKCILSIGSEEEIIFHTFAFRNTKKKITCSLQWKSWPLATTVQYCSE